jgi:hypothetical protein
VRRINTRRTIPLATAVLFASQLPGCAVLPERMSGFKEPTVEQQSDLTAATKYAQDVNGELLTLHDQYVILEDALIAGALGSGIAFGIATAFNGSKDLLAALGLAGGGLVAIDYASSAPQKIKIISEGRAAILCAINTAPQLTVAPAPGTSSAGAAFLMAGGSASSSVDVTTSAAPDMLDLAASLRQIQPNASLKMGFKSESPEALRVEQGASNISAAALNIVAAQISTAAIIQDEDYKAAVQQVSQILPPTPAQYVSATASDVAHSVFDLLDESNPSVSDMYNKAKAISPQKAAKAQAAVQKATTTTQQAKALVNSVHTAVTSQAADLAVPSAVTTDTAKSAQTLDSNAQTLTVLGDLLQKAKDCRDMNSGVWNIGG